MQEKLKRQTPARDNIEENEQSSVSSSAHSTSSNRRQSASSNKTDTKKSVNELKWTLKFFYDYALRDFNRGITQKSENYITPNEGRTIFLSSFRLYLE